MMDPIRIAHNVQWEGKYYKGQVDIWLSKYQSDLSYAIIVTEVDSMQQIVVPTRCMVEYGKTPPPGQVWVAEYSENEGSLCCLQNLGIVGPSLKSFTIGTSASWTLCEVLKTEAVS